MPDDKADYVPSSATQSHQLKEVGGFEKEISVGPVSGFPFGGHIIEHTDDFSEFSCKRCEETKEIPKLIRESTDSTKRIYQLLLYARFRNERCSGETISGSNFDTDTGHIITDRNRVVYSTDSSYTAGDTVSNHELTKLGK